VLNNRQRRASQPLLSLLPCQPRGEDKVRKIEQKRGMAASGREEKNIRKIG
jgi:hypothetical protein